VPGIAASRALKAYRDLEFGFKLLKLLIGPDATEGAVTTQLGPNEATILHFATHGYGRESQRTVLQDFAAYQGLILLPSAERTSNLSRDCDSLTPDDGRLGWREIASLNLSKAWLAVLSSCSSALGARRPGEGVLGMRWFAPPYVESFLCTSARVRRGYADPARRYTARILCQNCELIRVNHEHPPERS
jgi:hypothetical protein